MVRIKNAAAAIFLFHILLLSSLGCETTEVSSGPVLRINVEDIASTEARHRFMWNYGP